MAGESPDVVLYDYSGNMLAVQNATAIPSNTPALMIAGSDGINSRYITIDASGRMITAGAGVAGTPAGGVLTIQGVSGGTVVPISITGTNTISGTVTANIGTTNGLALDTSINGILLSQGSTTSGEKGPLIQGAVTTAAPSYTTAQTSPLSLTTTGLLRIDGSGVTQPVSGTVTANQGGAPWSQNVTQFGGVNISTGTGASGTGIPRVTVSNDSNILATQSGSWTVTSNQGTANSLANAWSTKITDTTNGPVAVKAASTAAVATDPALVVAISPNNAITVTAAADITSSGALGALNATVTVTHPGLQSVGMQLAAGTLVGTIIPEVSFDAGVTWNATFFDSPSTGNIVSSIVFGASNTAIAETIVSAGGAGMTRVRVSVYTSGTANATVRASDINDPSLLSGGAAGSALPPVVQQVGASVTTASPAYSTGTVNALSLNTSGGLRVDGSAVTQPVSGTGNFTVVQATAANLNATVTGTVIANIGTTNGLALDSSVNNLLISQGSTTSGEKGPLIQGAVTTAAPSYTTAQTSPLSLTTAGALRTDASGTTQPISGTVTANQGGAPWSQNVTQFGGTNLSTGTGASGAGIPRVTVSNDSNILATQSGTWTVQPGNTANTTPWLVTDSSDGPVTPGVVAGKSSLMGGQFNTVLPTLTNTQQSAVQVDSSGRQLISGTVNQGTANTLANAWTTELTDGTNGPVAVKAASTTPVAADPALVVTISPNSSGLSISPIVPIVAGQIYGHRFGFSSGAGAPQDLRATAYTEQASAVQRSLKSSSANDTSAGTGARTVLITYYNNTMNGPFTETITLNGTTAVNTVSTTIRFIESMVVVTAGTGLFNAGTITLNAGTAGTGAVIGTIGFGNRTTGVGDNQTFWAHHYIRPGVTCYFSGMSTSFTGVTSGQTFAKFIPTLTANSVETVVSPAMGARQAFGQYAYKLSIAIAGPGRVTLYNSATGGNEVDGSFEFLEQ